MSNLTIDIFVVSILCVIDYCKEAMLTQGSPEAFRHGHARAWWWMGVWLATDKAAILNEKYIESNGSVGDGEMQVGTGV